MKNDGNESQRRFYVKAKSRCKRLNISCLLNFLILSENLGRKTQMRNMGLDD